MRCQWHVNECDAQATQVCDVPIVGDSMCFCDAHVAASTATGWYPLTLERAAQEERVEENTRNAIASIRFGRR